MAKRRLTSFNFGNDLIIKLKKANLFTVQDILSQSFFNLMISLGISHGELQDIIDQTSSACLPQCHNAFELLKRIDYSIPLGILTLDNVLKGGIRKQTLTEFTGPPGVGKTQMCLHLSLNCLRSLESNNNVCFIDTECTFKIERFAELVECCEDFRGQEEAVLSKVFLHQPKTVESLTEILNSLELFCVENSIGLVVVDSIASLARKEFSLDGGFRRAAKLGSWAAQFKAVADHCNLAVVVTNQVTSRVADDDEKNNDDAQNDPSGSHRFYSIGPALGGTWTHYVNTRFVLQFLDDQTRQLIVAKSSDSPVAVVNYAITRKGIVFLGDLNFTLNGMDLGKHRIKVRPSLSRLQM